MTAAGQATRAPPMSQRPRGRRAQRFLGHQHLCEPEAPWGPAAWEPSPSFRSGCVPPPQGRERPLDRFPKVLAMRDLLSEDHTSAEFEEALEALLNRLDLELSQ